MRTHVDLTCDDGSLLTPCTCPECGRKCLTTHHLRGHMQRRHFPKVKKKSNVLDQKYGYLFGEMDGFKITVKPVIIECPVLFIGAAYMYIFLHPIKSFCSYVWAIDTLLH